MHGFAGVANVTSGDEDALVSAGLLLKHKFYTENVSIYNSLLSAVANFPVISIGIDASSDNFQLYGGGVCVLPPSQTHLSHSIGFPV